MTLVTLSPLVAVAKKIAAAEGCDPVLVCAVIEQESAWNQWAIRYEPAFMAKYVAPLYTTGKIHTATEAWGRSFSWGLMQLMGQVSRELGFEGPLAQLCEPETGIAWGCRHLKRKLAHGNSVSAGLLLWNGGGEPSYPQQVLARLATYR